VRSVPVSAESLGLEAAELSASAGLELDEWQRETLVDAMGLDEKGRWAAFEVGVNVARQNGKGAVLEARELAGLFLLGERLIVHSAHEFATSQEHFRRVEGLIRETPELHRQVKSYKHSHGEEGIELVTGQRIVFKTRTKGGSRGFSADLVVLDEAMVISAAAHGVMMPTLRASKAERGTQVWYAGSAVDQDVHEHGVVWSRVRERGINGDDSLVYLEWSADAEHPSLVTDEMAVDEDAWQQANPGLGVRISFEHMRREQRAMDARTFAVELLGVGDWPATDGLVDAVISAADWAAIEDSSRPAPPLRDPVCFAFDVSPERKTSIAAAGRRDDGLLQVEVFEHKQGTGWLPERLAELVERHDPAMVVCDGYGPVASVAQAVEDAGVKLQQVTAGEHGQACGQLLDQVAERRVRHLGSEELGKALRGAKVRPLGDAWAWSRKSSAVDISPLVASTLALWAAEQQPEDGVVEIF
jgi:phage terminase large subunit-like protein